MQPLVSVVIPNYNNAKYIVEALNSVTQQDYKSFEIVVVDDGSTDNSIEIIKGIQFPITLIESANFGAGSARNIGIMASRGEYIALLDSDDIWEKSKLDSQMKLMLEQELDLVYCHGEDIGNVGARSKSRPARYSGDCYPHYKKYPSRSIIELPCSSSLFRKSILHKSGLFDINVPPPTEDWDFFRRYSRYAKVGYCDEVLVYYRKHENNISSRSVVGYYKGNEHAIIKMIMDDSTIRFFERRAIWTKYHLTSAKFFLKNRMLRNALLATMKIVLPILL